MNTNAILALIGDLYGQLTLAQERITELEGRLSELDMPPANGGPVRAPEGQGSSVGVGES